VLVLRVSGAPRITIDELFLVDTGADRTVFREAVPSQLGVVTSAAPAGIALAGIGGTQAHVQVQAVLALPRIDGGIASVQANFAAFTDPSATDLSILGRDVLDHFDVILSRRCDELYLLAPPSQYEIHP
jgi:hypothetical protein